MNQFHSNRRRAAEVIARGDQFEEVRERETVEEPVKHERVASFLRERQPAVPKQYVSM